VSASTEVGGWAPRRPASESRAPKAAPWDQAAGRIEQHRAAYQITDPDRALGLEPDWSDSSVEATDYRFARVAADTVDDSRQIFVEAPLPAHGLERGIEPSRIDLGLGW
jgi:hypothetical protein